MSTPTPAQLFVGTFVDTPTPGGLRIRRDHVLAIDEKGYIISIEPSSKELLSSSSSIPTTHLGSQSFLLPTFSDLHLHAPQYLYAGTGLDLPLMQWLEKYAYRAEERIDASTVLAEKVYEKLIARLKEGGTGMIVFFGTIGVDANLVLMKKVQEAGIRAFIGKLSMDQSPRKTYGEANALASLQSLESFLDSFESYISTFPKHLQLVKPIISPRFVPTCSDELLSGLAKIGKERNVRVQSHMCEGRDQMDWVESSRGKKDPQVFEQHGLLGPDTLQAHVTYLDKELIPLVKERQVTMAHCPLSNAYMSERQFPLREALDAELSVGLGTDIAGGYSPSIQVQMRQAVVIARLREGARCESLDCSFGNSHEKEGTNLRVDWTEAMYVATRGGKKGMGLGGAFEPGMEFDAQLIELASEETPGGTGPLDLFDLATAAKESKDGQLDEETWLESIERWWCNGDERNRKGMWVQGVKVA